MKDADEYAALSDERVVRLRQRGSRASALEVRLLALEVLMARQEVPGWQSVEKEELPPKYISVLALREIDDLPFSAYTREDENGKLAWYRSDKPPVYNVLWWRHYPLPTTPERN